MPLAHYVVTTQDEAGKLSSRLSTNATPERIRARLARFDLLQLLADIGQEVDRERIRGGNAVLLVWKEGVSVSDLMGRLDRV